LGTACASSDQQRQTNGNEEAPTERLGSTPRPTGPKQSAMVHRTQHLNQLT
jgi:hypothetical protein